MSNGGYSGAFPYIWLIPVFCRSKHSILTKYAYTNFVPHDVSLQRKSKFFFLNIWIGIRAHDLCIESRGTSFWPTRLIMIIMMSKIKFVRKAR